MTAQDKVPQAPAKVEPFIPVWLRRRQLEGQAKDLTGAVKS